MKKHSALLAAGLFLLNISLMGQTPQDSLATHKVFEQMPASISIDQPSDVARQFPKHVGVASGRNPQASSFCIRIYSNSGQHARNDSAKALARFQEAFPEISVTRTYNSPYFMVSAGEFGTRREAEEFLKGVREIFPSAYIIRK